MTRESANVGIIGLGAMGMGMARALVEAGFTVLGCDVRTEALQELETFGGMPVERPQNVAEKTDLIVVMVVNAAQVEEVLFGERGLVENLSSGALIVLCSTVSPDYTASLAARLASAGIQLLDAPVSGGAVKASQGELTIMASGSPEAFAGAEQVLAALAEKVYRLGDEPGYGSKVKLVNQLLAGVHIAAAAEAMAFGIKLGLDPKVLYEVISSSAGSSWMFENRVPHMLEGDYTPKSAVNIFLKDLGMVLEAGQSLTFPLPVSATAHQLFVMAGACGFGSLDDAAVIKVFAEMTGIPLPGDNHSKSSR